jgi:hypothetical protein
VTSTATVNTAADPGTRQGRAHPLPTVRRPGADHRAVPAGQHRRPGRGPKTGCVNHHWLTPRAETLARAQVHSSPAVTQLASAQAGRGT